jgi:4-amino-4-deoxy-L-arabinose transferase-like glycosyltransferase
VRALKRVPPALVFAAIVGLGAFFRFHLLADLPPGLYRDEAMNGNNAIEAIGTWQFKAFYPENHGREGLYIALQAAAIRLFGPEPSSLRGVSAVVGVLTVVAIRPLALEIFRAGTLVASPQLASLLAAYLLATSYWHVNFSRIGFRAIAVPLCSILAALWLLRAFRTGRVSSAIWGGLATGAGLMTYPAFRVMPLVLAVPIGPALSAWRRSTLRDGRRPLVVAAFVVAAAVACAPLALHFAARPADAVSRVQQISVFSAESPALSFVRSNLLTLAMFNVRGDCNARHNLACQPQLDWPVGLLFLAGLAIALRRLLTRPVGHDQTPLFLVVWFACFTLPATLTTQGLPHALRSIGLVPPAILLAAVGGSAVWEHVRQTRWSRVAAVGAVTILAILPLRTYRDYFVRFAGSPETREAFAADIWEAGRYLDALPATVKKFVIVNMPGADVRGVPTPAQTLMFATGTFELPPRQAKNLVYVRRLDEVAFSADDAVVIVPLDDSDSALLEEIAARFPSLARRSTGPFVVFERGPRP